MSAEIVLIASAVGFGVVFLASAVSNIWFYLRLKHHEHDAWVSIGSPMPIINLDMTNLFAAGHTFGFLTFRPSSAEGFAVYNAMNSVHFAFNGAVRSYSEFYTGFGLLITAYLLFCAFLAWHLGSLAESQPKAIGVLAWAFVTVQLANFSLSVLYFFLVPALLSAVILVCLLWAAWKLRNAVA